MSRFQLPKNRLAPVTGLSSTRAVSYPLVAAASHLPPPLAKRVNDACAENTADFLRGLKQSTFPDEPTFTTGTTATRSSTVSENTSATTTTTARSSTSGQYCDGVVFNSVPSFTTVSSSAIHPRNWTTTEEPSTHMSQHVGDFQDFTRVFDHSRDNTLASSTRFYNRTRSFAHTLPSQQSRAPSTTSRSNNSTTQSFTKQSRVPSTATRFTNNTKQSLTKQSITQLSIAQQTAPPSPPVRRPWNPWGWLKASALNRNADLDNPAIIEKQRAFCERIRASVRQRVAEMREELIRENYGSQQQPNCTTVTPKESGDISDEESESSSQFNARLDAEMAAALQRQKVSDAKYEAFQQRQRQAEQAREARQAQQVQKPKQQPKQALPYADDDNLSILSGPRQAVYQARAKAWEEMMQQVPGQRKQEPKYNFNFMTDPLKAVYVFEKVKAWKQMMQQGPKNQAEPEAVDDDVSIMSGLSDASSVTSMVSTAFRYVSSAACELTKRLGFRK